MEDIGTLGCCNSIGNDINEQGDVAGQSSGIDSGGNYFADHAFLYSSGAMRDLGTLGGYFSVGLAVNRHRQVTGLSLTERGEYRAFLFSNGAMHDLNDLVDSKDPLRPHVTLIEGADINDHGVIVANGRNAQTGEDMVYLLRPMNGGGGGLSDWLALCFLALVIALRMYPPAAGRPS
jgi:probable HAF family extracellular repeat protein